MGQLRLAKAMEIAAFPGCEAVVDDTPGEAQCQESQVVALTCDTVNLEYNVTKVGAFVGIDLTDKKVTITNSSTDDGEYTIVSNTDDILVTDHQFTTTEALATATCHNAGNAFLTRSESSFIRFIENLGNAHSTLNGQLYTDVATGPLADACTDTYSPD